MAEMTVKIVTPDGTRYEHRAKMVVARTTEGEVGILPDHENMIAPLKIGEFKVQRHADTDRYDWIAVHGGIIVVKDNAIQVITDSAERSYDIDLNRAERAKARAERLIEEAQASKDINQDRRAKVALERALIRLSVGNK